MDPGLGKSAIKDALRTLILENLNMGWELDELKTY